RFGTVRSGYDLASKLRMNICEIRIDSLVRNIELRLAGNVLTERCYKLVSYRITINLFRRNSGFVLALGDLVLTQTLNLPGNQLTNEIKDAIEQAARKRRRLDFNVERDSAASVHCAPQIGRERLAPITCVRLFHDSSLHVVIVKRNLRVVALQRATLRRVIPRRCQHQARASPQPEDSLHKALSKCGFTYNQRAV